MYLPRNIWFVLVVIMISSCSTETLDVTSPTGKLGVTVEPMEGKAYDKITFSVNYDGKTILSQTELGLETDVQKFYGNLKLKSVSKAKRIVDDYKMITGKRSHCINEAFERTIIGYMKRVSNFSQARQQEAARRHYATPGQL